MFEPLLQVCDKTPQTACATPSRNVAAKRARGKEGALARWWACLCVGVGVLMGCVGGVMVHEDAVVVTIMAPYVGAIFRESSDVEMSFAVEGFQRAREAELPHAHISVNGIYMTEIPLPELLANEVGGGKWDHFPVQQNIA